MVLSLLLFLGATLPETPAVAPGSSLVAAPTLDSGVAAFKSGDTVRAIAELEAWLATNPRGRDRARGQFLLGWLYLDQERWNEASAQFTRVRAGGGPLQSHAAWYEAYSDHRRGRHTVAASECKTYRETWPDGTFADECLVLMGDAYVAAGQRGTAIAAYTQYLDEHPDTPRKEELKLGIALAEANANPVKGAAMLRNLTLDYQHTCTQVSAQAALDALVEEEGISAPVVSEIQAAQRNARSMRDCGWGQEAWESYQDVRTSHPDDPQVQAWSKSNWETFAWRTRQYQMLGNAFSHQYESGDATSENAWYAFRAYFRAGDFAAAGEWGELGLSKHGSSSRFRHARDLVAHALQMGGEYEKAQLHWDILANRGGSVGDQAEWFGAFCSYRLGNHEDALKRLEPVVNGGGDLGLTGLYYRGKVHDAMGNAELARTDWAAVRSKAPHSWYSTLLASRWRKVEPDADPQLVRQARWPGAPYTEIVAEQLPPSPRGQPIPVRVDASDTEPVPVQTFEWSALQWGAEVPDADVAPLAAVPIQFPTAPVVQVVIDPTYQVGTYYDPERQAKAFAAFAKDYEHIWPELPAAYDLATVGIYELAGEYVADVYEEYEVSSGQRNERQKLVRSVNVSKADWRQIFLYSQDYHHATRFSLGLGSGAPDDVELNKALRLGYPTAHSEHMEQWTQVYDVDPLLGYGLMRRESLYRSTALSHAGAIGVMQIMPKTGSKVAAMLDEPSYSPAVLEDPATNVRYGVFYLGALLDRFEGCWPMAVAGYNAGPVNVSSWYRPWKGKRMPIDDWVESLPLREPRTYVKKVSENYAVYTALYGPEGAVLHVPRYADGADKREVIDF